MTKTDELLAIRTWQRQYEWTSERVLRDATTLRQRRHLHDLYGQVQVIQLAGEVLRRRCEVAGTGELFDDLRRASEEVIATAKRLVDATATTASTPCTPAIEAGLARVRAVVGEIDATIATRAATTVPPDDLEHLVAGLLLARLELAAGARVTLLARDRMIEGVPWLELVCGAPAGAIDAHELAVIDAIVTRHRGELSTAERRDGGEELVVALPATLG